MATCMELVNPAQYSNYILLGDFNVDMVSANSPWLDKMTELANVFYLTQVVSEVTHVHYNGTATLNDQAFMSNVQLYHPSETRTTRAFTCKFNETKLNHVTAGRMVYPGNYQQLHLHE